MRRWTSSAARTAGRWGSASAAAVACLLTPLLVVPASAAGPTALVVIEPLGHAGAGSAGSCLLYRVVPRDATHDESVTSPAGGFVTVTLHELDGFDQQDVDFCSTSGKGDTFRSAPRFKTGTDSTVASQERNPGVTQYYNPGEAVTPEESANPVKTRHDVPPAVTSTHPTGSPDVAAVAHGNTTSPTATPATAPANNPLHRDTAVLGYDGEAGGFVFGVSGLRPGAGRIAAFYDRNGDADADTAAPTAVEPGGDVHAEDVGVRFTAGGAPWSLAAANAVGALEATPDVTSVPAGSSAGAPLTVVLRNTEGHVIAGVVPRLAAERGPNAVAGAAPTWTGSCGASNGAGRATCSYTATQPGADDVAVWVNQTGAGRTAGRDQSEPFDVSRVDVTSSDAGGTASPSPSAAGVPSPGTARPTPTSASTTAPTSSPTRSASAAPASSPTAPPRPSCTAAALALDREVLLATHRAQVVVQAAPGRTVRLLAYSRPSTTYRVVREGVTGSDGRITFAVSPLTSTRMQGQQTGCEAGPSQVLQVRSALTLDAARVGVRDVVFRGRAVPARQGQLVSVYRTTSTGRAVLTAQGRADGNGQWAVRRTFSEAGRFTFVARTGTDTVNAAGTSPARVVDVR